jgi:exodeoxyribonuclease V gamma subunit
VSCLAVPVTGCVALKHLVVLVRWFRAGRTTPLPFFDKSSVAFAKSFSSKKDDVGALRSARREWLPSKDPERPWPNDSEDASNQLCMRGRDALADPRFAELAKAIALPAFEHLRKDS